MKLFFFIMLMSIITISCGHKNVLTEEEENLKQLFLETYYKGHVESNGALFRDILHKDWQFFWYDTTSKKISTPVDKDTYISWRKPSEKNEDLNWNIHFYDIDVTKNLASLKVKIYNQDFGYLDYFTFIKENEKWLIVSKIAMEAFDEK